MILPDSAPQRHTDAIPRIKLLNLKLLLDVVTSITEALLSSSKFLFTCAKEVCLMRTQPSFNNFQQLIIVEVL
jgi:hypothetical protein